MIIKKTMNSNAVLATDDKGIEYILLGKGIGYGKKIGAAVEEDTVNQTFIPLKSSNLKEYMGILEAIPPELLEITREIVSEAERVLDCKLNPSIYFMLGDHLNFAVERFRSNISITNRVFWEIKTYYPKEFKLGEYSLKILKKECGVVLLQEEAANIAFHIINAQVKSGLQADGMNYAKLISSINSIIRYSISEEIDTDNVNYQRFITHLKFFAERFFSDSLLDESNNQLFEQIVMMYPQAVEISFLIKDHIEAIYSKKITKDEITYLTIHINRLLNSHKIEKQNDKK